MWTWHTSSISCLNYACLLQGEHVTPTGSVQLLPSTHLDAFHQMKGCREGQKDDLDHNLIKRQGCWTGETLKWLPDAHTPLIYVHWQRAWNCRVSVPVEQPIVLMYTNGYRDTTVFNYLIRMCTYVRMKCIMEPAYYSTYYYPLFCYAYSRHHTFNRR